MDDINLLYSNSLNYNGAEHTFTKTARKIVKRAEELVKQNEEKFNALESKMIPRGVVDRSVFTTSVVRGGSDGGECGEDGEAQYPYDDDGEVFDARGNIKQVVQAGDEDEFVDIEGKFLLYQYISTYGIIVFTSQNDRKKRGLRVSE